MRKRFYWLLSAFLLLALFFSSCQRSLPLTGDNGEVEDFQAAPAGEIVELPEGYVDTSRYNSDPPYTFCYSSASVSNSWQISMVAHLRSAIRQHPEIQSYYETDAMGNPQKQVEDIEDLVSQGCDVLLVTATLPAALISVVARVENSKIPVVTVNTNVSGESFVSFISQNGCDTARLQAEWLIDRMGDTGRVVLLGGLVGDAKSELRMNCATEVFEASGIEILDLVYTGWSAADARNIVRILLGEHGLPDGIWTDSGRQASGAMEAFLEAGYPIPPITGDDYNGFLKRWNEYGFDGYAVTSSLDVGVEAVNIALEVLKGNAVPRFVTVEPKVITSENLYEFVRVDLPDDYWAASLPEVTDELFPLD